MFSGRWWHDRPDDDFGERLDRLEERQSQLERNQMSQQRQIDADTAALAQVAADLAAAQTKLQAEIDALAAANPALNLDGLNAAVAPLDAAAQALGALVPTPPGPPAPLSPPPAP